MIEITRDALERFAPRPSGDTPRAQVWDAYAAALIEHGPALLAEYGIDRLIELQHFMAQVAHECGGFTILWEGMRYRAPRILEIFGQGRHSAGILPAEAKRLELDPEALAERVYGLGNPRKSRELGNTQPGDGYKYRGFGILQTTGRADHERLIGGDYTALGALKAALAEWDHKGCNDLAAADDLKAITKRINGGYNGLDSRRQWLTRARRVWRDGLPGDAPIRPPPETMAQSTTGNTSIGLATGGGLTTANEISVAMAKVADKGTFSAEALLLALLSSPAFWIGVITIVGAAYIWLERRRRLLQHGV